ncbi:hypothetical protein LC048_10985 [Mesobacillus subterraneus]|nr:hypothetical protein [Mesobacillus subterraneus]WLR57331.1 hypothetical protein LC048_10985 [Mesobacillus subterraneus]
MNILVGQASRVQNFSIKKVSHHLTGGDYSTSFDYYLIVFNIIIIST